MRRTHLLVIVLALLILPGSMVYLSSFVAQDGACVANAACPAVVARGSWFTQGYDLVYTVAFSRAEQPNGPLVVYRPSGTDLPTVVPVIALKRGPLSLTPLFFPSPDGRALALLMPTGGYENALQGGTLSLLATDGSTPT